MKALHNTPRRAAFNVAAILFAVTPAWAQLTALELSVETRADAAILPSGPASTLVVTPCAGCKQLSLPAAAGTRYFIGRELVTLTEFRKRLANRPTAMLAIYYLKDSRELSRVVASAP